MEKAYVLKDKWTRIAGMPLIALIITLIIHKDLTLSEFTNEFLICLSYTIIFWEGNRFIIFKTYKAFPDHKTTAKRILIQLIACISFTSLASISLCIFLQVYIAPPLNYAVLWLNLRISLIATLFVATIYECFFFFSQWKNALLESELLKRENLFAQFEMLKSQVSPHFLFNCLNTLMTIIPEDPKLSMEFVQKLSSVYRYLLQNKEKDMIDLGTELNFIKNYIFLNKIRFGENLIVDINIPEKYITYQIAPLTMQMLIENAIKHNIVSTQKPLKIEVFVGKEETLIVKNNLQKKITPVESTQTGLQNIINRYKFLTQKMVDVIVTTSSFMVALPLLKIESGGGE